MQDGENPLGHLIDLCGKLQETVTTLSQRVATLEIDQDRDRELIQTMQMRGEEWHRADEERICAMAQLASAVDDQEEHLENKCRDLEKRQARLEGAST